jgi:hypothetical protein
MKTACLVGLLSSALSIIQVDPACPRAWIAIIAWRRRVL